MLQFRLEIERQKFSRIKCLHSNDGAKLQTIIETAKEKGKKNKVTEQPPAKGFRVKWLLSQS